MNPERARLAAMRFDLLMRVARLRARHVWHGEHNPRKPIEWSPR